MVTRSGTRRPAREERALGLLDLDEPGVDERGARLQTGPRGRSGQRHACKLQREPDARAPAAHVVVQVAVQRLEPGVEIGRERDQQQLDVRGHELERALDVAQAHPVARGLRLVGARLDVRDEGERLVVGRLRGLAAPAQQPVDIGLAQVQAAEAVVGRLVRRTTQGDGLAHAPLEHGQPASQVVQGGIAGHRASRTLNVRPGCASVPACTTSSARGRSGSGSSRAPRRRRRPFGCSPPTEMRGSSSTGFPAS